MCSSGPPGRSTRRDDPAARTGSRRRLARRAVQEPPTHAAGPRGYKIGTALGTPHCPPCATSATLRAADVPNVGPGWKPEQHAGAAPAAPRQHHRRAAAAAMRASRARPVLCGSSPSSGRAHVLRHTMSASFGGPCAGSLRARRCACVPVFHTRHVPATLMEGGAQAVFNGITQELVP